jgi:hypothetical protein
MRGGGKIIARGKLVSKLVCLRKSWMEEGKTRSGSRKLRGTRRRKEEGQRDNVGREIRQGQVR